VRVLLIGPFPPAAWPEADKTVHLAGRLAARGLDVHVLTERGSISPPAAPFRVHPRMRTWSWTDLPRLVRTVRRHAPDVVLLVYHADLYHGHPMPTFIPTVAKRLLSGSRVVTLFEDAQPADPLDHGLGVRAIRKTLALWAGSTGVDWGLGTLLRDSDRLIMVSDRVRRRLVNRRPDAETKSVVIPTPAIMPMAAEGREAARRDMRAVLGLHPADILLVYLGYLYPGKGVETLLEALPSVRSGGHRLHLLVVGGTLAASRAYAAGLRDRAARLGIAAQVTWTGGYAWESEMPSQALSAADLCVLPFDEGVCLHSTSLAAAATHGLPIITTHGDGLETALRHGANVYLCPPKDPLALARAIETLLGDGRLRTQIGAGAEALAAAWYDWERVIDGLLAPITGRC
jgi:glycosyltransferase involved in cell wall biosynthesis